MKINNLQIIIIYIYRKFLQIIMDLTIRKTERADLSAVLGLVTELAVFENEPYAVTASLSDYEQAFDKGLIFGHVATLGSEVVGMTLCYEAWSTWKGRMMYLDDFYVKQEHRSKGIGDKLFDAMVEESRNRNCVLIKWQVLDWNTEAMRFYERKEAELETNWYNVKLWL